MSKYIRFQLCKPVYKKLHFPLTHDSGHPCQFYSLDDTGILDINNGMHWCALHIVFLPVVNNRMDQLCMQHNMTQQHKCILFQVKDDSCCWLRAHNNPFTRWPRYRNQQKQEVLFLYQQSSDLWLLRLHIWRVSMMAWFSHQDSNIADNSHIWALLETSQEDGSMVSDSGYTCHRYLLTPLLNPVSSAQQPYNRAQTAARNCIKQTNGVLKRWFPILK